MPKHIYIFKIASRLSLSNLAVKMEEHGEVISMREELEGSSPPLRKLSPIKPRTDENRESTRLARLAIVNEKRHKVYLALAPILRENQHAPLNRIVALMNNTTDIRNERNNPWTEKNIEPYLTYTLEKMTEASVDILRTTQ